jgi:hypothetical protein
VARCARTGCGRAAVEGGRWCAGHRYLGSYREPEERVEDRSLRERLLSTGRSLFAWLLGEGEDG